MYFVLEVANNHQGSLDRAKKIVDEFKKVTVKFPQFKFAFKFQRRSLANLIHPDHKYDDIPYLNRFRQTQMDLTDFDSMIQYTKEQGFLVGCTPFDETSALAISSLGLDFVKIGSCSANDWPLLNEITTAMPKTPIIASVGGVDRSGIWNMVKFFKNREIPLTLMHCVGLYPTNHQDTKLDKIDLLKGEYPELEIGFSTHEGPMNYDNVIMAIAKGVRTFEKHVDIERCNNYSILPDEFETYLTYAKLALETCGIFTGDDLYAEYQQGWETNPEEVKKLDTLKRGAFFKRDCKSGEIVSREDLYFAMPIVDDNQYTAFECSKYTTWHLIEDVKKDEPVIHFNNAVGYDNKEKVQTIHDQVVQMLKDNYVVYPPDAMLEISHHYGLKTFNEYGMSMITIINGEYCKKLLILLPFQLNPYHWHTKKKETFFVLSGEASICFNDQYGENRCTKNLQSGGMITVDPMQVHSIQAGKNGAIIEELSTEHQKSDSYYIDDKINTNHNRKTTVYL